MTKELADRSAAGLEHYEVHEHIGSGAMGDVFKVTDKRDGKEYVLKQMSLRSMSDTEKLRAKQEINVMNEVDHPNVVMFRESFSGADSVDIVMEYCECGTLEELIERQRNEGRPFPGNVLIEWMAELLCALAYIHAKGIIHRDIKTGNIFVTTKNHLKLGDFGVCTLLANRNMEATTTLIGTPLYFAPEVCEQLAYDERSDVWSLGIVFYEMCTLRRPFQGCNLPSLIQHIVNDEVAPFNTGLDARFEEIVRNMLSKDPHHRPTAQELIDVHLEVPVSHPSHPSQKPSIGRYKQQNQGPTLSFTRPWPPPKPTLDSFDDEPAAPTSEWIATCEGADLAMLLRLTAFGPATDPTTVASSSAAGQVAAMLDKAVVPSPPRSSLPAAAIKTSADFGTARPGVTKNRGKAKQKGKSKLQTGAALPSSAAQVARRKVGSRARVSRQATTNVVPEERQTTDTCDVTEETSPPLTELSPHTQSGRTSGSAMPYRQSSNSLNMSSLDVRQELCEMRRRIFGHEDVPFDAVSFMIEIPPHQVTVKKGRLSTSASMASPVNVQSSNTSFDEARPSPGFLLELGGLLEKYSRQNRYIAANELDDAVQLLKQYQDTLRSVHSPH